jgi:thiol-disulfide isomerase/thioredoxin
MLIRLFSFILLSTTLFLYGCERDGKGRETAELENTPESTVRGNLVKAPDFTLKDIYNNEVKLSDFRGKVVILDFWATWCPPCRKGIPDLIELQTKYNDDLMIIGISLDQANTIKDVVPFSKNYGINYPVVYGDANVVSKYGGIEAIPTSFIIDKEGNIIDKHVGLIPKQEYEKYLQ